MKKLIFTIFIVAVLNSVAFADWTPSDPYKMHFPQLPDPQGWDVKATTILNPNYDPGVPTSPKYLQHKVIADDWRCTETGPVSDIHFWGSWLNDVRADILNLHLSIHADNPDPDGPTGPLYSTPGDLLWSWDTTAFTIAGPFPGIQGWYNPNTGEYLPQNHLLFQQYNIENIPEPFVQEKGTIYWLDISVTVPLFPTGTFQPEWGWKTSLQHFNDDATWCDSGNGPWFELRDPAGISLDMAFVITPEPCSIIMLGLVSLCAD